MKCFVKECVKCVRVCEEFCYRMCEVFCESMRGCVYECIQSFTNVSVSVWVKSFCDRMCKCLKV